MNEFNKPYEYEEEKGVSGILLLLFVMLVALEPFLGIIAAFFVSDSMKAGILQTVLLCGALAYILFSVIAGILLKKVNSHAVAATKGFLVYRLFFLLPFIFIYTASGINGIPYSKGDAYYQDAYNSIIVSFIISLIYILSFSVLWFIYMQKSKKIREHYLVKEQNQKTAV